jgi:hypothetical protein
MKRAGQTLVFLLCIGFSAAAFYNVTSDNADVERLAATVACGDEGPTCHAQKTSLERTPIAQTFELVTAKRKVGVRCARSLIFIGEYACALQ